MGRAFGWVVFLLILFIAYQAHWLDNIIDYISYTFNTSKQEKTIHNPDGSTTTVRYKNVFDIILNKD